MARRFNSKRFRFFQKQFLKIFIVNLLPVDPENEAFQESERKLAANTQEISSESESEDSEKEKADNSSSDDEPEFTRSRLVSSQLSLSSKI